MTANCQSTYFDGLLSVTCLASRLSNVWCSGVITASGSDHVDDLKQAYNDCDNDSWNNK